MADVFNKISSLKSIEVLFFLYVLTFPFGANLLSVSVGFMTIYPNLLILLFIFLIGTLDYKKVILYKAEYLYLLFVLGWLLFSIVFYFFVEGKQNAIIDIRSVGMMFLTSYAFIWVKNKLGYEKWREILAFCFKIIFFMFALFAAVELMTGLHFVGSFTEKIINIPNASFAYAPVFLYDNQNTFIVYFLLVGLLSIILDKAVYKKPYFIFLVTTICFLFAQISLARIGNFASVLMIVLFGISYLPLVFKNFKDKPKNRFQLYSLGFLLITLLTVTFTNEKFYGPIWENSMMVNAGFKAPTLDFSEKTIQRDSIFGDEYALRLDNVMFFDKVQLDSNYNSSKVRAGLFLNGYYFFKDHYITGIGPGQYRDKHQTEQNMFYTKTNISPHFWLIELISQFGLIIFIPYIFFLMWVFMVAMRHLKAHFFEAMLVFTCLLVFGLASMLPSSFLVLDINWIFLVVLIILANHLKSLEKE